MSAEQPNWKEFKALIATPDLPELGPGSRSSRRTAAELNQRVDQFLTGTVRAPAREAVLRGAALLWHDHLDASHEISQDLHTPEGSFLHGIMHRRERDYANAKYWFHRVGHHPAFPGIVAGITPILKVRREGDLLNRLAPGGSWDPARFVDACEEAAHRSGDIIVALQTVQEVEFDALLAHLFATSSRL